MPSIDVKKRRIDSKIVYYGPGHSGKTANLRYVYEHLDSEHRGALASLPTKNDPNLKIDVLPVRFGKIVTFQTIFHLCAGPGQALANRTRKLLLRDTDGIVFVADSDPKRRDANLDSLMELRQNLEQHGLHLDSVPHVVQYNKRDLAETVSIEKLRADLNRHGVPDFAAATVDGEGVMETLRAAVRSVSRDLERRL
ncbi:MAG: ADP-ribosylation factor-like protein [Candidatus Brocadiia bacterium]